MIGAGVVALAPVLAIAGGRAVPRSSSAQGLEAGPAMARIRAEGRIVARPGAKVTVGAEQSGRLARVLVSESSEVKAGDLVAELDSELVEADLAQARARLADARLTSDYLGRELRRAEGMQVAGLLSDKDAARSRHDATDAAAKLAAAEAEVSRLEIVAKKTKLVAPISGVVVQRFVSDGETLAPGAAVATIVDLSRLRVEAEVDEIDAPSLVAGTPVTITAESAPGQSWKGTVEQVPGAVVRRDLRGEETERPQDMPVLLVKVALAEPVPLRLGQEVSVFLGPEPSPSFRARPQPSPGLSASLTDPAAALLLDPVSRETVSAALTTILGTVFFVLVRRRLGDLGHREDDDAPRPAATTHEQDGEDEEDDSDAGVLDGMSEDELIVLDDSDSEHERPALASSTQRH